MKLRAFGRNLEVLRSDDAWAVFDVGSEGKKRPATDIVLPPEISSEEVMTLIGDLLHEYASDRYPEVVVLG